MEAFKFRSREPEMMDDFFLGSDVIDPIMDELEVVNKLLGGYRVFFNALKKLDLKDGTCISDWGCGGGDSLRVLAEWARKKNLRMKFVGVDATQSAVAYARARSGDFPEMDFIHSDVFSENLRQDQFDVVISSLFTHHFDDDKWIALIRKMLDCSKLAVVVNDLHRHWFAYHSIGVLTRVFSRSEMVKHDSKLSVMKGFRRKELEDLLQKAGITNYKLRWMWAFRWQLIIKKNAYA